MIGWLIIAAWMGALSAHRFFLLSKYPESQHRFASVAYAVALALVAISALLVGFDAPPAVVGFPFMAAGLISVVMLVTLIARGIRPRRIRHTWRNIGDPAAWRGERDLDR